MKSCGADQLPRLKSTRIARYGQSFNIMFAGHAGSCKTSLINALFDFDFGDHEKNTKNVSLIPKEYILKAEKVQIKLTIIETKGIGNQESKKFSYQPIVDYIDDKNQEYQKNQQSRYSHILDNRVHCCIYIISPFGPEPIDMMIMKELSTRVCLIPVIGCSGYLSVQGVNFVKEKIRQSLTNSNIEIYGSNKYDLPFAIIASNEITEENGKPKRTKMINNARVSIEETHELSKLRNLLFNEETLCLIEATDQICFEKVRSDMALGLSRDGRIEYDTFETRAETEKAEIMQKIRALERQMVKL